MKLQEVKTVEDIQSFLNCRTLIWMQEDYPFKLYGLYDSDYPISITFTPTVIKWSRRACSAQTNFLFDNEEEALKFQHELRVKYLQEETRKEEERWSK